jgi:hypothetical protein
MVERISLSKQRRDGGRTRHGNSGSVKKLSSTSAIGSQDLISSVDLLLLQARRRCCEYSESKAYGIGLIVCSSSCNFALREDSSDGTVRHPISGASSTTLRATSWCCGTAIICSSLNGPARIARSPHPFPPIPRFLDCRRSRFSRACHLPSSMDD